MSNGNNPCENCSLDACEKALTQYNELRQSNQQDSLFYTLDYLLFQANNGNGAIGENNATTQGDIVDYLNSHLSTSISVQGWQQGVLQNLKDTRIVATKIYPGGGPGTFIPCKEKDIKKPIQDLISRIKRELEHLENYSEYL